MYDLFVAVAYVPVLAFVILAIELSDGEVEREWTWNANVDTDVDERCSDDDERDEGCSATNVATDRMTNTTTNIEGGTTRRRRRRRPPPPRAPTATADATRRRRRRRRRRRPRSSSCATTTGASFAPVVVPHVIVVPPPPLVPPRLVLLFPPPSIVDVVEVVVVSFFILRPLPSGRRPLGAIYCRGCFRRRFRSVVVVRRCDVPLCCVRAPIEGGGSFIITPSSSSRETVCVFVTSGYSAPKA